MQISCGVFWSLAQVMWHTEYALHISWDLGINWLANLRLHKDLKQGEGSKANISKEKDGPKLEFSVLWYWERERGKGKRKGKAGKEMGAIMGKGKRKGKERDFQLYYDQAGRRWKKQKTTTTTTSIPQVDCEDLVQRTLAFQPKFDSLSETRREQTCRNSWFIHPPRWIWRVI